MPPRRTNQRLALPDRHDPPRRLPVSPNIHIAVRNLVVPKDRADVRAMVVPMVERLYEHDTQVQLEHPVLELGLDHILRPNLPSRLNQPIPTHSRNLPKRSDARKLLPLTDRLLPSKQPNQVPLLGPHQVLKRGRHSAVRPWTRQLQLLLGQLPADLHEEQVRPPVITKSLDQKGSHNRRILGLANLSRYAP
jgi:hypothetical protein